MAVINRAISFYRMEYHQPDLFLQRTNASEIVDSPFLDTSGNQLNQINSIPAGSGLFDNGSCFNMYSPFLANSVTGGESMGMVLGNVLPMQNPERTHVLSQTETGSSSRVRKKHRHDQDGFDYPSKRRKLSVSPVLEGCQVPTTYNTGHTSQPCWNPSHSQVAPAAVTQSLCILPSEMQPVLTEGMDETTIESQSDAALRRIRDIESRLVVEDDDDGQEEENKNDRLPTLVMSDILVESLKKGLDESLTKKIVDSMNRPSMELVLWKPQPEYLVDRLQRFTSDHKDGGEASKHIPETPFLRQPVPLEEDKTHVLDLDCDIEPMWGREEEEMEL